MNIEYFKTRAPLSQTAVQLIIDEVSINPGLLLCAATGNSPIDTYELLSQRHLQQPGLFDRLRLFMLDEWGGVPENSPGTCGAFLKEHLQAPLNISDDRYFPFISDADRPEEECQRMQHVIKKEGPIDICVLGLGANGHVAFNEPGEFLHPYCHTARLSEKSLTHSMTNEMVAKPTHGLTLGMADILGARKIIIIITGKGKQAVIKEFLSGKVSTSLPASLLWLHPDTRCLIDNTSL